MLILEVLKPLYVMISYGLKLIIIYIKKRQNETQIAQNGLFQSLNLTWLSENPSSNRFRITLVHVGRPVLKLCKSPAAESTVEQRERSVKVCNETACFGSFQFPGGSSLAE